MKCSRCQQDAPSDAEFCPECGTKLAAVCAQCGTANASGHKFCKKCGYPLTSAAGSPPAGERFGAPETYTPKHLAEKILTSKAALEGERKQVTVLFADLKGSMELLADRDPEEARKLLDPVLEHMMEAVHRYEGTVNQVMGDGIMALFGAPLAHEDHAVRACYAALRMQESVKRYAEEVHRVQGIPLQIRVGLNSGEVVVRSIGSDLRMDYTAVGQTTHLAARMEQLASPGSILVTPATLALVEGYVEVQSLGPTAVKGLPEPVEIHELKSATAIRSRLQAAAVRGLTKFVGRSEEISQIHAALGLARNGNGQVVGVIGEPGVGKSRLCWEFVRSHRSDGHLVLEAPSASYGKATAYQPILELLRSYFAIEPGSDLEKIGETVRSKLLSLDRALEPSLPALLSLLDVPTVDEQWARLDPSQRRQRTLDGLRRLLLRESQAQPVVVIFEDLHWIDSETQAFLDALVESVPTARLLLLVNYRPEYRHDWGSKTYYRQIRIDPLPATSMDELLDVLLGRNASIASLKSLLAERVEGNPFFLEESVRMLVEMTMLAGETGAYQLSHVPESLEIPATAQSLLAARIDRLGPDDKRLLQAASVIGKDVPLPLLEAVAGTPTDLVRQGLSRLQSAEFLYETRIFPEIEYTFKHALTHEATYSGLLLQRRRELHARIVVTIEQRYPDRLGEHVERLAHHSFHGELWDRALTYLRQAGTKAMDRGAPQEAVPFYERGLLAVDRLAKSQTASEQAVDFRMLLANSLMPSGQVRRIAELLSEAQTLAETLDDMRRLGRVFSFMTVQLWMVGNPTRAAECGARALTIARDLRDFPSEVRTRVLLGQVYWGLGDYRQSINVLATTAAKLNADLSHKRLGFDFLPAVVARSWLAASYAELGEFDKGTIASDEAIRIAEAAGNQGAFGEAHLGLGFLGIRKGDVDTAIPQLERGLEVCRTENLHVFFSVMAGLLAYAYTLRGRHAEALTLFELSQKTSREEASAALRFVCLAEALLRAGHIDAAVATARRALDIAREHRERGHEAHALNVLGLVHAADPTKVETTLAYHRQAIALASELGMRPLVAHCHLGLSKVFRRTGKGEQAEEHLTTAATMYREMDMQFWTEKVEQEMKDRT